MLTFNTTCVTSRSGRPLLSSALGKLFCTHPNRKVTSDALQNIICYFSKIIAFYFSLLLKFFELFHLWVISSLTKLLNSFIYSLNCCGCFPPVLLVAVIKANTRAKSLTAHAPFGSYKAALLHWTGSTTTFTHLYIYIPIAGSLRFLVHLELFHYP